MLPRRKWNWQTLMSGFLREAAARPFSWLEWNCCLFPLAHVDNIVGTEFYSQFAERCADAASAQAALDRMGGLEAAASGLFGPPLPNASLAQRGDVVSVESGRGLALAVVDLTGHGILALTESAPSLIRMDWDKKLTAWRI